MVQHSSFLPTPLPNEQVGSKAVKSNQRVALGWVMEWQQCFDAGCQCPHGCTLSAWQEFSHLIPISEQTVGRPSAVEQQGMAEGVGFYYFADVRVKALQEVLLNWPSALPKL